MCRKSMLRTKREIQEQNRQHYRTWRTRQLPRQSNLVPGPNIDKTFLDKVKSRVRLHPCTGHSSPGHTDLIRLTTPASTRPTKMFGPVRTLCQAYHNKLSS